VWADGVYVNVRLPDADGAQDRLCLLVIVGVRPDGAKELVAVADGHREDTESWLDVLRDLRDRGMRAPELAVGDGALGFWGALRRVFPSTREQRCWVHKAANCMAALPKRLHADAKAALAKIHSAQTRAAAVDAAAAFAEQFSTHPKATAKITGDLDVLLAFYDFPAEHSTTSPPSTGSTCAPRTRSSRRSPPCGCVSGSPRDRAVVRPAWRWRSSCSRPPRPGGAESTVTSWSRSCAPGRRSSTASCKNETMTRTRRMSRKCQPRSAPPEILEESRPQLLTMLLAGFHSSHELLTATGPGGSILLSCEPLDVQRVGAVGPSPLLTRSSDEHGDS